MTITKKCPVCSKMYGGRNKYTCSMTCYAIFKSHKKTCSIVKHRPALRQPVCEKGEMSLPIIIF